VAEALERTLDIQVTASEGPRYRRAGWVAAASTRAARIAEYSRWRGSPRRALRARA
jgi:hypothetical protein